MYIQNILHVNSKFICNLNDVIKLILSALLLLTYNNY
jgi:hypothetical protein